MREIVLDTETTGLDPRSGHRIVEIGCVELLNHVPTGRYLQHYLNPDREIPKDAMAVHGLTDAFLADKPRFVDVADAFLGFIGDSPLVMHNAPFDLGFLNCELERIARRPLPADRAVDTVQLARQKFPGAPANLDALCRRFEIDLRERERHGALTDARLLAAVYLELKGGREPGLALVTMATLDRMRPRQQTRRPRLIEPTLAERAAHDALVGQLDNALWLHMS
jgi:DNA polymerase-3 subunit epsilon